MPDLEMLLREVRPAPDPGLGRAARHAGRARFPGPAAALEAPLIALRDHLLAFGAVGTVATLLIVLVGSRAPARGGADDRASAAAQATPRRRDRARRDGRAAAAKREAAARSASRRTDARRRPARTARPQDDDAMTLTTDARRGAVGLRPRDPRRRRLGGSSRARRSNAPARARPRRSR